MFIVRKVKGIWHCRATNLITPARCRVPTVITNMQTRANKFEIWTHPHHGRTALKWQIRFVGSLHESDRWWWCCWCAFGDGLGQKLAAKSNCIEISTSPTSSPLAAKIIKKSKLLLFLTYDKDKQRVPPPRGFSAPAPWKVPPPRGIPDECPRLVAYIWRGHFGWIPWGGGTPLNLS